MKRGLRLAALGFFVLAACGAAAFVAVGEPRPAGRPSGEADLLARRILEASNFDAWARTGAMRWTHFGRDKILWDRKRAFARLTMGSAEVLIDTQRRTGIARDGGELASGDAERKLLDKAYRMWVNDVFWLNPIATLFNDGVSRSVVDLEGGGRGLLVEFGSGGVTPGDAYLFLPGDGGLPRAMQMWVSVLPVGGVRATFEDWQTLSTGARIATKHRVGPATVRVTDLAGAETFAELEPGPDPFAELTAR